MFALSSFKVAPRLAACRFASTGVVKFFNTEKGYGFITKSNGEGDVFVHYTGIKMEGFKELMVGQNVVFEEKIDPRTNKVQAYDVTLEGSAE